MPEARAGRPAQGRTAESGARRGEPLRRRLRTGLLRGLARAPDGVVRGALAAAAGLARWSSHDQLARANLELALGCEWDAEKRARVARGVRAHAARQLAEWLRLSRAAAGEAEAEAVAAWIDATVELDPTIERLDRVAARGRGVLVATAHLGNWELLAAALRRRGLDGAVVGRHRLRDSSSDWLVELRRGLGVTTLAQDEPARRMLRVLSAGGTLGLLCDLRARRLDSAPVPFFGRPTATMTAPAALARAARTPVVPVRCVARGERYLLSVEEPLELASGPDRRGATLRLLTELNAVYERWIRADPEQWAWHQPRWRA